MSKKDDFLKMAKKVEKAKNKTPRIPINPAQSIDLIPSSHKTVIERNQARRTWFYITSLVLGLCAIVIVFGIFSNITVRYQISKEKALQQENTVKIEQFADVDQVLKSEKNARNLLNQAAGRQVNWDALIGTVQGQLPMGTSIQSMSTTTGGTEDISSAVTLSVVTDSTLGYSDTLRAIQNVNGISNVKISGLTADSEGKYSFTISFTFDNSVLTNTYSNNGGN